MAGKTDDFMSARALPKVAEWRLSRHPLNVSRSRTLLQEQAYAWRVEDETVELAVLLLSELMTNAYRHARVSPGREIGLRCVLGDRGLRVEVSDASDELPRLRDAALDDESGRGLALVAAFADAWGAFPRPCGIGKTVWFELKVPGGDGCLPP